MGHIQPWVPPATRLNSQPHLRLAFSFGAASDMSGSQENYAE